MSKHGSNVLPMKKKGATDKSGFNILELSKVPKEKYDWLWRPYIARGELIIVSGDPNIGKSFLIQQISKWICDGEDETPNGYAVKQGRVLYFDYENDPSKSTRWRMEAMGCKNLCNFRIVAEPFSIRNPEALADVRLACEQVKPDLVVFDTLNRYLDEDTEGNDTGAATHNSDEFLKIAREHKCAVVILQHNNKNSKASGIQRTLGSISWMGVPRLGMAVAEFADEDHPHDERWRGMLPTKHNDTAEAPLLPYRIEAACADDPAKIVWDEPVPDVSLDELYASTWAKAKDKEKRDEGRDQNEDKAPKRAPCAKWLLTLCQTSKVRSEVIEAAIKKGFARKTGAGKTTSSTLDRAILSLKEAKALGVYHERKAGLRSEVIYVACDAYTLKQAIELVRSNKGKTETEMIGLAENRNIDASHIKVAIDQLKRSPLPTKGDQP